MVEGDAEFILIDAFFQKIAQEKLEDSDVHVISVGGTSFKRYLDIAKILQIKTAVIRDNDGDYQANCVDNYSAYPEDYIHVFADKTPIDTHSKLLFTKIISPFVTSYLRLEEKN